MMNVTPQTLILLAGLVWYGGATALLFKTVQLLSAAQALHSNQIWPWLAIVTGLLLGVLKGRFLFGRACTRNIRRITALERPRIWQFFRPPFFILLAGMILLGRLLSLQAQGHYRFLLGVAVLDLSIAVALLGSSAVFWMKDLWPVKIGDRKIRKE
jgi:hypothetical protein